MTDMLVELIQNFIGGAESTLNSLFNSMLNLVFFIERELMYIPSGQIGLNYKVDFNQIYQVVFNYATYLLVIVFIVKAIKIYFLLKDGDNEQNPVQLVIGMLKAVIVMICFKEIYTIGVGIVSKFLNSILDVMNVDSVNLAQTLSNNIQRRNIYSNCLFSIIDLLALTYLPIYNEGYRTISNENSNTICYDRFIKFRQWSIS